MDINRNTTPVVLNGDTVIGMDGDVNVVAESRHRLVHAVVHNFVHEVVKPLHTGAADIHGWAFTDRLKAFKHTDTAGVVSIHSLSLSLPRISRYRTAHAAQREDRVAPPAR